MDKGKDEWRMDKGKDEWSEDERMNEGWMKGWMNGGIKHFNWWMNRLNASNYL